ncbi:MAG: tryptophan halogenase family protein [Xanthomonadaceae bacterium]|nr:tryptophan halogenase family protein [Xanthomonadaceae bacterium]MDZ4379537.1 tryptophan halogenase family protein [Xanthomonadaceae bacterium]
MSDSRIQSVVIVGGGTAGWMAAAILAKAMGPQLSIRLIESEEIGIVGVGEATIPQIRLINSFLGVDENEVLRASQGTFKLGIEFNDWRRVGDSYLHAFGETGMPLGPLSFHHYWLRSRQAGDKFRLWDYSLNTAAAEARRFGRMDKVGDTPVGGIRYAYHFDAGLYGQFLRRYAEQRGVRRSEGKVVDVHLRAADGFIESVQMDSGERVEGDLFLDCSGFRGLLIEGALKAGFDDWSQWLPCNRAVTVASARVEPMRPYTQSNARPAGWQWRIPLQHRTGNGHVYCSDFMSEDEASALLLANLDGEALAEPRALRFTSGIRNTLWQRNCVALGLASGFVEPLESTAIHLVQSCINRLLTLFPDRHCDVALRDEFNRQTRYEFESVRDFLVLHYKATERDDTPFWRHCAQLPLPDRAARKVALFRASGQIVRENDELFTEGSWLQVMLGQGIVPQRYHPSADAISGAQLDGFLRGIRSTVVQAAAMLPGHSEYVAGHCRA